MGLGDGVALAGVGPVCVCGGVTGDNSRDSSAWMLSRMGDPWFKVHWVSSSGPGGGWSSCWLRVENV